MKAVFVDAGVIDPGDMSWENIENMCDFTKYDYTPENLIAERIRDAEAVFVDSAEITSDIMHACSALKFIGVAATGYDNVDITAAKKLGIAVANVPAYSSEAVAQHAFALIISAANRLKPYDDMVRKSKWIEAQSTGSITMPIMLLKGRSLGIIGYGNIGRRVGELAEAFGMTVNIYSRNREAAVKSDILSLHCPLTADNCGMINKDFIDEMKDGAILINTARGGLIDENALAAALRSGKISAAGLDVLSEEPPGADNVLLHAPNCIITPHIAFTPHETRKSVVDICGENLRSFINGDNLNRLV